MNELAHAFCQAGLGTALFMLGYLLTALFYISKGHQW